MSLLSSCTTKTIHCNSTLSKYVLSELPVLPIAGASVGDDLKNVCNDQNCKNIKRYLNEMYVFGKEYQKFLVNQGINR